MAEKIRVVFMGTPEIAVPALRAVAQRADVTLVVTQPDRPAGRGQKLQPPPVKVAAEALGIPVWQPDTLRGAQEDPRLQGADLFIVMAYGELLRQKVLDLPRFGCVNLHASLLPRWRGASPLQAVIRAGDAATGVSVMRMVRALDAGPVWHKAEVPLDETSTLPWLHDALMAASAHSIGEFIDGQMWMQEPIAQDPALVTHCGKLLPADGQLDFSQTRDELHRWVRAYVPAPGCWVPLGGDRLRIHAVAMGEAATGPIPGTTRVHQGRLEIACADGWLVVTSLQSPGKKRLDVADWLRGNQLPSTLGV